MNSKMGVISPEGLQLRAAGSVSRHLDTLAGKTIGEVYNNHFKGELMFQTYRRLFKERYPGIKIILTISFRSSMWAAIRRRRRRPRRTSPRSPRRWGVDALISGNGG